MYRKQAKGGLTVGHFRVTIVAVEKQWVLNMCVCSLSYPVYEAHAPYCYRWPLWLHHIFPYYLINGTIFGKKVIDHKIVFWFSLQLSYEKLLILRRIKQDVIINLNKSSCKVPIRVGAELFHVDRRTDMTKLIVTFRKFANAPKNGLWCDWRESGRTNSTTSRVSVNHC
jgi:hypothetical protein